MLSPESHLRMKDKGWKKILHANGNEEKIWGSNTYI